MPVDPETRDHRHVRRDRGDGRGVPGARRSGRRGDRLRAVLRELRPRRDPRRREAASSCRSSRRTGASTPTCCARRSRRRTKAIIVNTPHNPTGRVLHARGDRRSSPTCASSTTCGRSRTRSTSTSVMPADHHLLADVARHARAHGHDLRAVEDVQLHRLAPRLRDRAGARERRHPQGARLPHRGRAGAAAGGRRPSVWRSAPTTTTTWRSTTASVATRCCRRSPRPASSSRCPEGAYYVLADFSELSDKDDVEFALWLARRSASRRVPGSSFYHAGAGRGNMIRFAFCKKQETLERAAERIVAIRSAGVATSDRVTRQRSRSSPDGVIPRRAPPSASASNVCSGIRARNRCARTSVARSRSPAPASSPELAQAVALLGTFDPLGDRLDLQVRPSAMIARASTGSTSSMPTASTNERSIFSTSIGNCCR